MDTKFKGLSAHSSSTSQQKLDSAKSKHQDCVWSEAEKLSDRYIRDIFGDDYVELILGDTKFNGEGYNDYIDQIKRFIYDRENYNKMTTSQLRNIFARVQKINSFYKLYLLRPKLAFIAGKSDTTHEMKTMIFLLDQLISKVNSPEKLEQFKDFYEAVIAYHKYYGGKES
jgi:CRISPR type III-A-associated protein Csm2